MARTKHQIVQKVAVGVAAYRAGKRRGAKNSDLKRAAHQGRTPVTDPRNAQPGFAAVPVSTATLAPGQGPPMSSTPGRGQRGRNSSASRRSAKATASFSGGGDGQASRGGGRGASSRRRRGR